MPRLKIAGNTKQKKRCNPSRSFPCGYSCQAIGRNCRKPLKGQGKTSQEWLTLTAERMGKVQGYLEQRRERGKPVVGQSHVAVIEAGRRYIGDELPSLYGRGDYERFKAKRKEIDEWVKKDASRYTEDNSLDNRAQLERSMGLRDMVVNTELNRLVPAMTKLRDKLFEDSAITSDAAKMIADAISYDEMSKDKMPEKKARQIMSDFFTITNGQGADTLRRFFIDPNISRAYAYQDGINIGHKADGRVFFHEMGHHAEFGSDKLKDLANDWIRSRSSQPDPVWLGELTGDLSTSRNEVALPDDFYDPYVGRVYPTGSTEVISTGLEHFHSPEAMAKLYVQDPEHFELIIGIIRG